jgi:hypothetical protein
MREKAKYRIKENNGEFSVEIYGYKEKGILWWKRKEWHWFRTNSWGGVWNSWPIPQPYKKFKSLEEARQQIKTWKSDSIFHYVN